MDYQDGFEDGVKFTREVIIANIRVWADRVLQDAQSASSVLTDEVLNCSIRLLHKGGDTSDMPSDWRSIPRILLGCCSSAYGSALWNLPVSGLKTV